jgi:Zn-dependent M28 family amino/carboxypeptidase
MGSLGFDVERHGFDDVVNPSGVNVVGTRRGTSVPQEVVMVGAHYDHVTDCPGADDNASGVAGALEIARVLAQRDYPRTLVVAFWDQEESGHIGSNAYVERAILEGEQILIYYNLEMIGYATSEPQTQELPAGFGLLFPEAESAVQSRDGRGDFIALVADESAADEVELLASASRAIGLPAIDVIVPATLKSSEALADLRRSDHAGFWDQDYPAIMLTDTSNFRYPNYHCWGGADTVDQLDAGFATKVVQAVTSAAAQSLGAER